MELIENLLQNYKENIATLTMQPDGIIVKVNQYFLEMIAEKESAVIGKNIMSFDSFLSEKGVFNPQCSLYGHYHSTLIKADGHIPIEVVFFRRSEKQHLITLFIKDLNYINKVKFQLSFLLKMFSESKEAVMVTDERGYILCVNESFREITGYSNEDVLNNTPAILNSGKQDKHFYKKFWHDLTSVGSWQGEIWNKRKNGDIFPEWLSISSLRGDDGQIQNYICQFVDTTALKKSNEEKHFLTYYDPLTSLPNRTFLFEKLQVLCESHLISPVNFAIFCCDLDRFKFVNDTYGHKVGDEVLRCIAKRLQARLRSNDILARSGDDEFIVIIEGEGVCKNIDKISNQILSIFDHPFRTKHGAFSVSASIGISQFPSNSSNIRELMFFSDVAMQKVKKAGGNNYTIFDSSEKPLVRQQRLLEQDIKIALKEQQLEVYYQPQVNSTNNEVYGVECLLRWNHPTLGIISPVIFIPIIESNGMINEVGDFVIETACKQIKYWKMTELYSGIVAINVSIRQFENTGFVKNIQEKLEKYVIDGDSIELEVTESLFSENNHHLIPDLSALRKLGITIAIDDFGTGYSSLQRLKNLPIDNVKIDKCFVDNIVQSQEDAAIINALIVLSKTFGFDLIAEGIETKEQAEKLNHLGCFNHQGFLYGKPLTVTEFEKWLAKFNESS